MAWNKVTPYNTKIHLSSNDSSVVFHTTTIVKWNSSEIVLNSGGWDTSTTKTRMNQVSNQFNLGYNVYQENFKWSVVYKNEILPFTDNMILKR